MAPKKLAVISIFLIICGNVWYYADHRSNIKLAEKTAIAKRYKAEGNELTKELKDAQTKMEGKEYEHSAALVNDYYNNMRKSYFHVIAFLAPISMDDDIHWPYRFALWDISMMLLGIALFKWKVLTAERSFKFYGLMMAIGYAIGLSIILLITMKCKLY